MFRRAIVDVLQKTYLRDIFGPVYGGYVIKLSDIYPVPQFDSQNLRFSKYDIRHFQLIHPMQ